MAYGGMRSRAETQAMRVAPRKAGGRAETMAAEAITFPVLVGLVHFALVQMVAALAYLRGTPTADSAPFDYVPTAMDGWAHALVEPLRHWDGLWYKLIALEGYAGYGGAGPRAFPAFWPLYPWLMRAVSEITGAATETAGWLISNLAFFGALVLLYRLVALDFDRAVARRTLWALALFPTAFFFSAVYTESLFLLLAVGALLAARTRTWLLAGLLGTVAAMTRSQGVFLLAPFAVLLVQQYGGVLREPRRWLPSAVLALLPLLGPVVFGLHLKAVGADRPFPNMAPPVEEFSLGQALPWALDRLGLHDPAFVEVQWQWNRFSADPLTTFRCAVAGCVEDVELNGQVSRWRIDGADWGWVGDLLRRPAWGTLTGEAFRKRAANSDTLELVCTLLFLTLAVAGLRALPFYQSAYLWPPLVVPLFAPSTVHPLMSIPRFGLVLFPLFVVLALTVVRRRAAIPLLVGSALLLVLLTAQFAQWYWVS